jgi:hypothetical protein
VEKPAGENDLSAQVTRFCLTIEQDRRTPEGRIRSSEEFLAHYFPHDDSTCTDRVFRYLPNEVRGPIIAAWGIRGGKAAARDNNEKVQSVFYESLVAGDVDHSAFEDGLTPETLIRWIPLSDYWAFWRAGKLTKHAIRKALETGDELVLFDAKWFLDTIESQGGRLRGTDVLADGLTKADLTAWVHRIHESRDGSPRGLLNALGWESIVAKTPDSVLISMLDAMAAKVGLKAAAEPRHSGERATAAAASSSAEPERAKTSAKAAAASPAPAARPTASVIALPTPPAAPAASDGPDLLTDDDLDLPEVGKAAEPATTPKRAKS